MTTFLVMMTFVLMFPPSSLLIVRRWIIIVTRFATLSVLLPSLRSLIFITRWRFIVTTQFVTPPVPQEGEDDRGRKEKDG
jgi:hypothetical protein